MTPDDKLRGLSFSELLAADQEFQEAQRLRAEQDAERRYSGTENSELSDYVSSLAAPSKPRKAVVSRNDIIQANTEAAHAIQAEENIGNAVPFDFGQSRFDKRVNNLSNFEDLEDFRAREQSGFNKILSGSAKGGVTAVTTFADSILGSFAGLVNVAAQASSGNIDSFRDVANAFIDNPFSHAMQQVNAASEDLFRNYQTAEERGKSWYQNIFTANFLGDTILKNAGFTIGAAYGARLSTQGIARLFGMNKVRDAYKGLAAELGAAYNNSTPSEILTMLRNGTADLKDPNFLSKLELAAKKLKRSEMALKMAGAAMAGAGEARIEAINAADELEGTLLPGFDSVEEAMAYEKQQAMAELQEIYPGQFGLQMQENNSAIAVPVTPAAQEAYEERMKAIEDKYAEIAKRKAAVANTVFALNFPLLTMGDAYQFGRFILGDYAVDRATKSGIKSAAKQGVKEAIKDKGFASGVEGAFKAGYELEKGAKKTGIQTAGRALGNALVEMSEEMNQSWISSGAKDFGAHRINEFIRNKTNPSAEYDTRTWLDSVHEGLKQSWGNTDDWVEGFAGFFMGAFGLPGIRVKTDVNGKKKLNVQMQGGIWEPIRESRQYNEDLQATVDALNNRLQDPKFLDFYRAQIARSSLDRQKEAAAKEGDKWAYEKADQMQIINDIMMFDKAGRLQDYQDMIDGMSDLSDEDLKQLKDATTSIDSATGNVVGALAGMTDAAIKERVSDNVQKMKDNLDKYIKASRAMTELYGSSYSRETIDELVWKTVRLETLEDDIKERSRRLSSVLGPYISEFKEKHEEFKDKTDFEIFSSPMFVRFVTNKLDSGDFSVVSKEDSAEVEEDLVGVANGIQEREAYLDIIARTSSDPSVIENQMAYEASRAKTVERMSELTDAARIIATAPDYHTIQGLALEDGSIDPDVLDEIKAQAKRGNAKAQEFLDIRDAEDIINEDIDNNAGANEATAEDVAQAKRAWAYLRDNALSAKQALSPEKIEDIGVEGLTDKQFKMLTDAAKKVAKMEAYDKYLKATAKAGDDSATEQDHAVDTSKKLKNGVTRAKIILKKSHGVTDAKGNPVTGTYYIYPETPNSPNIYDRNGNSITERFYVPLKAVSDVGAVGSGKTETINVPFTTEMLTQAVQFTPGVDYFTIKASEVDPWKDESRKETKKQETSKKAKTETPVEPTPSEPPVTDKALGFMSYSLTPASSTVRPGDTVQFGLKKKDGTVYLIVNNAVVGQLPYKGSEVDKYYGLREFIETLREEYNEDKKNIDGYFISSRTSVVRKCFDNVILKSRKESPVTDITGMPSDVHEMKFALYTIDEASKQLKPMFSVDGIRESDIAWDQNRGGARAGSAYYLRPLGDGRYKALPCRQLKMTSEDWARISQTPFGRKMYSQAQKVIDRAASGDDAATKAALGILGEKFLYLRMANGNSIGARVDSGKVQLSMADSKGKRTDIGTPVNTADGLLSLLFGCHVPVQVMGDLNTNTGRAWFYDNIVANGLLTMNIEDVKTTGKQFNMDFYDPKTKAFSAAENGNSGKKTVPPKKSSVEEQPKRSTTSGAWNIEFTMAMFGEGGFINEADNTEHTWAEFKDAVGEDKAKLLWAKVFTSMPGHKPDSANSVDGKVLVVDPDGNECGYNTNTGKLMKGVTMLRKQLGKKVEEPVKAKRTFELESDTGTPAEAAPASEPETVSETPAEPVDNPDGWDDAMSGLDGFQQRVPKSVSSELSAEDKEVLDASREKHISLAMQANSVYKIFKTLNSKNFASMGSDKNVRKALKKAGLNDAIIDFLLEGMRTHPAFKNMTPYEAFTALTNEMMYDLAAEYNEGVKKPADRELDAFLENYLKPYNIGVKYADLKSRFGNDVVGLFDIIGKTIYLANGGQINKMTMPEEFAHAFIELMGSVVSNRPENADFSFLMNTVEQTSIFKQVYNTYKDVYTRDGKPDMYRIRKEAVGQALASALVHNWENKPVAKEKTFWDKLKELFEKVLALFKNESYVTFQTEIDKIANEILLGDTSRLHKYGDPTWNLLDYVKTIEEQNAKDGGKAVDFMHYFNSIGTLITGSLAYRREGSVYRGGLDALHDIDMIVPGSSHDIDIDGMYENKSVYDQIGLLETIKNSSYVKQIVTKYPKMKFMTAYADKFGRRRITTSSIYSEDESLSERFISMQGSYADRLNNFTEEERGKMYLFDFFLRTDEVRALHDDKFNLDFVNSNIPRYEKQLYMGRAKDIYDYQMWRDFDEFAQREISDSEVLMMQRVARDERRASEAISKPGTVSHNRSEVETSPLPGELRLLKERGWTDEQWNKLSDREKDRAKDCCAA